VSSREGCRSGVQLALSEVGQQRGEQCSEQLGANLDATLVKS
jgi:hypothetical protein